MKRCHWIVLSCVMILWFMGTNAWAVMPVVDFSAIEQLIQQLDTLKQQSQYIQAELEQLKTGQYQWSTVQPLMGQLETIMQQANGLNVFSQNVNQQFQKNYPGDQSLTDYQTQTHNNLNIALSTLNNTLQSQSASANDFKQENRRLQFLQRQVQGATGQTQAIQAASQMSSELVSQLQLLRQSLITQTNAQATVKATQLQQQASQQAEFSKVMQAGSTQLVPYGTSGESLEVPNFH